MKAAPKLPPGLRLLVVEDEALVAEELRERLTRLGARVVGVVDTGEDAIRLAAEREIDFVLMDINLKGAMDGIEAATRIREGSGQPVVFISAYSDPPTVERARKSAPFGFVLKPFEEADLRVALATAHARAASERRLKATGVVFAATLASIPDAVIAIDVSGRVTFMNVVAEELTGYELGDAVGRSLAEVFDVHGDGDASTAEVVRKALEERRSSPVGAPSALAQASGPSIIIEYSVAPVIDGRDELSGAVIVFRDIRQRLEQAEALMRAKERLVDAQRMESIGRLAGGIAHDFNNLLTVIGGSSDMLQDEFLEAHVREMVDEIRDATGRASALTRQLLAYSRRQVLYPRDVDLGHVVGAMERMLRRLIGEHVTLVIEQRTPLPPVHADPGQMEQVIMNLAVNARDAMPRGGRLTITTSSLDVERVAEPTGDLPPGSYVELRVSDTGQGIPREMQGKIFEPYYTTKEVGEGTGLGLATVAGIVEQSGGRIVVESKVDEGTTFIIQLPVSVAPSTAAEVAGARQNSSGGRETILLVEDEEAVRHVTARALKRKGYEVLEASSGTGAIAFMRTYIGPLDLVVTDVVMPGLNGREMAEQLLAMRPSIKVLYLSGYTDDVVLRMGVMSGEQAFLQKPFSMAELAHTVRELLDVPDEKQSTRPSEA